MTFRILTFEELVLVHRRIMVLSGDSPQPVLTEAPLRSAVERAAWGPFEGEGDLAERAALLLRAVVEEHPFADGTSVRDSPPRRR